MSSKEKVLITGASTGIGAIYADRFAKRGFDLVLVARDKAKLTAQAERLAKETGVAVEVLPADLANPAERATVEAKLAGDGAITTLINNAGIAPAGSFLDQDGETLTRLIAVNVTAPTLLARAIAPRLAAEGRGAIVNISSVLSVVSELGFEAYGATKAYVSRLSQSLALQFGPKGVYVQAVLPAATRTDIWEKSGVDVNQIEGVMDAAELVDAALTGFDRREIYTVPPLQDEKQWLDFEAARIAMLPNFRQEHAAPRYRGKN
jgi:Short-chain dehydrogenases of various substrate specificities